MKPDGVVRVLEKNVRAGYPVLMVGAPGVGKTDIAKQVAQMTDRDLVVTMPSVEDPTDSKGFAWPSEDKKSAQFLPYGQLQKLLTATKPTLWLIDDLGQGSNAVQAANMQWLLAREVAGHRLPDCVSICSATNRRQDRANVQSILEPVKSRFATIIDVEPDLNQWCNDFALAHGKVSPLIVAYLRYMEGRKESRLLMHEPTSDIKNSPSPRTWVNMDKQFKLNHDPRDRLDAFAGAVGRTAAQDFLTFEALYSKLENPDLVLTNPETAKIPKQPDHLWVLVSALIARVNEANFGNFAKYAVRLKAKEKAEFATLMLRGAVTQAPEVQNSKDFTRVVTSNADLMFSDI